MHTSGPRRSTAGLLLLALCSIALCIGTTGCIERLIHITSEPSGALVHLNDEEVGRTPVTVPFNFYGTYDVRLEADGYQPLWTAKKAEAPWWETPPIDLFAEAVPNGRSHLDWHFQMELQPAPDEAALIDRARQMQALTGRKAGEAEADEGPDKTRSPKQPDTETPDAKDDKP